jgi:hypothetical protein
MRIEFDKSVDASPTQCRVVLLAIRLGFKSMLALASSVRAHQFMDATPYGYSRFISATEVGRRHFSLAPTTATM